MTLDPNINEASARPNRPKTASLKRRLSSSSIPTSSEKKRILRDEMTKQNSLVSASDTSNGNGGKKKQPASSLTLRVPRKNSKGESSISLKVDQISQPQKLATLDNFLKMYNFTFVDLEPDPWSCFKCGLSNFTSFIECCRHEESCNGDKIKHSDIRIVDSNKVVNSSDVHKLPKQTFDLDHKWTCWKCGRNDFDGFIEASRHEEFCNGNAIEGDKNYGNISECENSEEEVVQVVDTKTPSKAEDAHHHKPQKDIITRNDVIDKKASERKVLDSNSNKSKVDSSRHDTDPRFAKPTDLDAVKLPKSEEKESNSMKKHKQKEAESEEKRLSQSSVARDKVTGKTLELTKSQIASVSKEARRRSFERIRRKKSVDLNDNQKNNDLRSLLLNLEFSKLDEVVKLAAYDSNLKSIEAYKVCIRCCGCSNDFFTPKCVTNLKQFVFKRWKIHLDKCTSPLCKLKTKVDSVLKNTNSLSIGDQISSWAKERGIIEVSTRTGIFQPAKGLSAKLYIPIQVVEPTSSSREKAVDADDNLRDTNKLKDDINGDVDMTSGLYEGLPRPSTSNGDLQTPEIANNGSRISSNKKASTMKKHVNGPNNSQCQTSTSKRSETKKSSRLGIEDSPSVKRRKLSLHSSESVPKTPIDELITEYETKTSITTDRIKAPTSKNHKLLEILENKSKNTKESSRNTCDLVITAADMKPKTKITSSEKLLKSKVTSASLNSFTIIKSPENKSKTIKESSTTFNKIAAVISNKTKSTTVISSENRVNKGDGIVSLNSNNSTTMQKSKLNNTKSSLTTSINFKIPKSSNASSETTATSSKNFPDLHKANESSIVASGPRISGMATNKSNSITSSTSENYIHKTAATTASLNSSLLVTASRLPHKTTNVTNLLKEHLASKTSAASKNKVFTTSMPSEEKPQNVKEGITDSHEAKETKTHDLTKQIENSKATKDSFQSSHDIKFPTNKFKTSNSDNASSDAPILTSKSLENKSKMLKDDLINNDPKNANLNANKTKTSSSTAVAQNMVTNKSVAPTLPKISESKSKKVAEGITTASDFKIPTVARATSSTSTEILLATATNIAKKTTGSKLKFVPSSNEQQLPPTDATKLKSGKTKKVKRTELISKEVIKVKTKSYPYPSKKSDESTSSKSSASAVQEHATAQNANTNLDHSQATSDSSLSLSSPNDHETFSSLHCFARKNLAYFSCNRLEAKRITSNFNLSIVPGQVGIRCIHCVSSLGKDERKRRTKGHMKSLVKGCDGGAIMFPSQVAGIYDVVKQFIDSRHWEHDCQMATTLQKEYQYIKKQGTDNNDLQRNLYSTSYAFGCLEDLSSNGDGIRRSDEVNGHDKILQSNEIEKNDDVHRYEKVPSSNTEEIRESSIITSKDAEVDENVFMNKTGLPFNERNNDVDLTETELERSQVNNFLASKENEMGTVARSKETNLGANYEAKQHASIEVDMSKLVSIVHGMFPSNSGIIVDVLTNDAFTSMIHILVGGDNECLSIFIEKLQSAIYYGSNEKKFNIPIKSYPPTIDNPPAVLDAISNFVRAGIDGVWFDIVENQSFVEFINIISPNYKLPSVMELVAHW